VRVLLGAFGDPGHAFPMLGLGAALVEAGHEVGIQTWKRWRDAAADLGMEFSPAPEYQVFPTQASPMKPYAAAVRAASETVPFVRSFGPDVAVSDILTAAPALAAELCGVPVATLVPHLHPWLPSGLPPFSIGARMPRTRLGARLWRLTDRAVAIGLEQGRREYNEARARLGLKPLEYVHTGLSRSLTLIATFPQLEYPRAWEPWLRVVGPLLWEPPGPAVEPARGSGPVVLIAPSTAQDPTRRLLRAALEGLADEPVRMVASTNGPWEAAAPANATLVEWMSYARTMPSCDLVVCTGGSGTLHRALASGCPVVVVPAGGDMAENAARADWAGVGVRLPMRFCTPWGVRLAVRRALSRPSLRARARELAAWAAANPGPSRAVREIEAWISRLA
jgi:UDP:flavonoid glycosyltransferase YjiC (YdhE family)